MSNTYTPSLSIIIVSYNTREMTMACLASIFRETNTPCEVIVVDNSSNDGSADAIEGAFPHVKLLRNTENLGFARAHEPAVAETSAPWLLLLNPDTLVLNNALDRLLDFAQSHPKAGIWGGRTLNADRTLNPASCWAQMTAWSVFCTISGLSRAFPNTAWLNPEAYGGWQRNEIRAVDIVSGCLFLIRRETWEALGGFDPVFTMYGEEADLCLRAKQVGHSPMITPDATIVHYGGASESVRADKMVRLLRAKIELSKRHGLPAMRGLTSKLLMIWPLSRWYMFSLAARLLRRTSFTRKAQTWKEIWQRRAEWRTGYTDQ